MSQKEKFKTLPILEGHDCFACGQMNHAGLQMKFFTDETSVFSKVKIPGHFRGWNELVHGGIVSAILDEIMGWSAIYLLKKVVLTKSITIDFLKPVFIDTELKAEGKVLKIVSEREAIIEGIIYNQDGKMCTRSEGTFSLLTPEVGIRLKVVDEKALKDLQPLLADDGQ
ncbi:MAG: PaaI family thioesterase [Desulfobacteraceae bacterium]|nr:PaaI family thioesterase [Desulfobacteraceae bacterium]